MAELMVQVNASAGDGSENASGSMAALTGTSHRVPNVGDILAWVWSGVAVPQGALVSSAKLEVYCNNTSSATTANGTLKVQNADNAALLTSANYDVSGRTALGTTQAVSSVNLSSGGDGFKTLADGATLGSMVHGVVGRAGWESGNRLCIWYTNASGGDIQVRTWDNVPARAAKLTITYTVATGGVAQVFHHVADGVTRYNKFNRIHG